MSVHVYLIVFLSFYPSIFLYVSFFSFPHEEEKKGYFIDPFYFNACVIFIYSVVLMLLIFCMQDWEKPSSTSTTSTTVTPSKKAKAKTSLSDKKVRWARFCLLFLLMYPLLFSFLSFLICSFFLFFSPNIDQHVLSVA
jgi:hypothetical protein